MPCAGGLKKHRRAQAVSHAAFKFCLPTAAKAVPVGPDWIHEIKYDGYRLRIERRARPCGWSRDATSDIVDALAQRVVDSDDDISAALQDFIATNATRRFDVQLALPVQGAA